MRFVWTRAISSIIATAALISLSGIADAAPPAPPSPAAHVAAPGQRISGPFTSENMSVYLIHGKNTIKNNANILTLEEALAKKAVKVHETSDVNNLSVENLSNSVVFLQSGDIVRGGKQDRAIQYDMLLQPKSGKVSLQAFCVEQGRWQGRGGESADGFSQSKNVLPSKELRLAAKHEGQQQSVWNGVAKAQSKLAATLKASTKDAQSESSLELSMEKNNVKAAADKHVTKLSGVCDNKDDVIGYAVAINGKIENADVYGSNALFKKLWPKLLKASSIEAVSEKKGLVPPPPAVPVVVDFLKDTKVSEKSKVAHKNFRMSEQETASKFQYNTRALPSPVMAPMVIDNHGTIPMVHKNFISK